MGILTVYSPPLAFPHCGKFYGFAYTSHKNENKG